MFTVVLVVIASRSPHLVSFLKVSFQNYTSFGSVAQLVEQRPEEPCVTGSSPVGATRL